MNCSVDLCLVCLTNSENLQNILSRDSDGIVIEEKCRFILIERVNIKPEISYHVCLNCLSNLDYVYRFKQMCLVNIDKLNNYVEILRNLHGPNKHFQVTLTDLQRLKENESANEILPRIEETRVKEEVSNNYEMQEEKVMHENDEFAGKEKPEDINNATDMQHRSISYEDRRRDNFLKDVKKETEFIDINEKIDIKDEQLSESTDSDSEDNSNDKLQNEEANSPGNISTSSNNQGSKKTSNDNSTQSNKKTPKFHKCDVCNKTCSQLTDLVLHRRIHTGEKPFKCIYCDKEFTWGNSLLRHARTHTGDKPHKCDICEKAFISSQELIYHKRVHTGERPYECDICRKAFISKMRLMEHKRMHAGEKPYECDVCHKTLASRKTLKAHKRIHTGEKPFECDMCQEAFMYKNALDRHKRVHSGVKP